MKKTLRFCLFAAATVLFIAPVGAEQPLQPITLPKPRLTGGKPLMQALAERKSQREFLPKELPAQVLSDLLWAADGINRPESGKRTAPTAVNWQEIAVYVATAQGTYLYDAARHQLAPVLDQDIRGSAGIQPFVKIAPVCLIYVADYARMGKAQTAQKDFYSATDTGFISQNVYLFCASEGLATVVLGMVDKPALGALLKLRPDQKIILSQPVGYPKK